MICSIPELFWQKEKQETISDFEPVQIVRTVQKAPNVENLDLAGVAQRQQSHSCFGLDSLVAIKLDITVNHLIGFGECIRFVAVDALRFENREKIFCHCVIMWIPAS